MVTELLNNQSGSDSIISSVEEMQHQLNEQEATTESINILLAEKNRENSELQMKLSDINGKFDNELEEVLKQNELLVSEKEALELQLTERLNQLEDELKQVQFDKSSKLDSLSKELHEYKQKYDEVRVANQSSEAKVQTLEDVLKKLKKGNPDDLNELMDATNTKAHLLALTKEKERLSDKLEGELDARKLLEDHVKVVSEEVASLRQGFNQAEKDKLEAQTRLEVLSTYFKEKETQLQK